jgi:hypothetical protein
MIIPLITNRILLYRQFLHALSLNVASPMQSKLHAYEVRPRKRSSWRRSDALPFGRLWYGEPNAVANAIGYVEHCSRSHNTVIRVYDDAGNVIERHEHKGDLEEW